MYHNYVSSGKTRINKIEYQERLHSNFKGCQSMRDIGAKSEHGLISDVSVTEKIKTEI